PGAWPPLSAAPLRRAAQALLISVPKPAKSGARPAHAGCAESRPWMAGARPMAAGCGDGRRSTPRVRGTGLPIPPEQLSREETNKNPAVKGGASVDQQAPALTPRLPAGSAGDGFLVAALDFLPVDDVVERADVIRAAVL